MGAACAIGRSPALGRRRLSTGALAMIQLDAHPSGRHFLQIPGPTNVPDRVLRAIDAPTIDHRGPEFARAGQGRSSPA